MATKKCPKGKEAHHIKPVSLRGTDDPENIRCVTPEQHKKIHAEGEKTGKTKTGRKIKY
nr:HNH endonuclease signature motif containing protein [Candidatus Sigynarchaeum springense]MDO8116114.1 HNH endonuclease signature motif containing protein [Candidatus Sigynarchaeota archaeon]